MAVTFLLKERNGFGGPAGGGRPAPIPGEGYQELPSPHCPAKGQLSETGTRALGACREPSSLRGDTHCTRISSLLPNCLCHTTVHPGMIRDPCPVCAACQSLGRDAVCWELLD